MSKRGSPVMLRRLVKPLSEDHGLAALVVRPGEFFAVVLERAGSYEPSRAETVPLVVTDGTHGVVGSEYSHILACSVEDNSGEADLMCALRRAKVERPYIVAVSGTAWPLHAAARRRDAENMIARAVARKEQRERELREALGP